MAGIPILSIAKWDETFENDRTRRIKGVLSWVRFPLKQGSGYCRLMRHPRGPEVFGCYIALAQTAANCRPRGQLVNTEGEPYTIEELSDMTRIQVDSMRFAIDCLTKEIGWLCTSLGPRSAPICPDPGKSGLRGEETVGQKPKNPTLKVHEPRRG